MDSTTQSIATLLASLTEANRRQRLEHPRTFKIGAEKIAFTKALLAFFYKQEVENRGMAYRPMQEKPFIEILQFLTSRASKPSLLLYGTTGTGKTTMATAIRMTIATIAKNELQTNQLTIASVKATELGNILKNDAQRFEALKNKTVLFLDDLGFFGEEKVNDYGTTRYPVGELLEHRYDRQLATICTSNLDWSELGERYGERLHSRMAEMFKVLTMTGQDYRTAIK